MRSVHVAFVAVLLLGLSTPALAHHSGAMFDRTRTMQLTGTVVEFNWQNPHASFKLDVVGADGKTETWDIEMNGPSNLIPAGWKRSTLKPGDKVTVTVNPLRDGRPGGWYLSVITADGKTLGGGEAPAGDKSAASVTP
jgi:hypothetical protein